MNELRHLREELGLTRDKLAEKIGRTAVTIERYECELPPELRAKLKDVALAAGRPDLAAAIAPDTENPNLQAIDKQAVPLVRSVPRSPVDDLSQILKHANEEVKSLTINGLRIIRAFIEREGHPASRRTIRSIQADLAKLARKTKGIGTDPQRPGKTGT